jgi:hypothetical protein
MEQLFMAESLMDCFEPGSAIQDRRLSRVMQAWTAAENHSLRERRLPSQGSVANQCQQLYRDEFAFRFNRREPKSRSKLLLFHAAAREHASRHWLSKLKLAA